MRDLSHRNIKNIEVLLADQIQQQIEWTFESFEKYLQRIRRNVEVIRQLEQRLAVELGEGHAIDDFGGAVNDSFGAGVHGVQYPLGR